MFIILVSNADIKFIYPEKTGVFLCVSECVCVCVYVCVRVCKILLSVNMVTSYRNTR